MGEEGTLYIITKGAVGKPKVLPNSNSLLIAYNPTHALKNLAPNQKAVQIWDLLEFHGLVNKVACGKYLAFSTWAQSVVGLV